MDGWIKIHRKILSWEWYHDTNTFKLFIHFLLIANVSDKKFRGTTIKRGSFIRTISNLANETGLTVDEVRTAIKHLELTNEITKSKCGKNLVFSIVCYDDYQDTSHDNPTIIPNQSQRNPNVIPQSKERKNDKKDKNIYNTAFTPPSLENVRVYCQEQGLNVDAERFIDFYESKGWMVGKNKMKNWKAACRNWARSGTSPSKAVHQGSITDADLEEFERRIQNAANRQTTTDL